MLKAIIHNDDLGLTYGFNEAILDCYTYGITTSTSIRTNGTAYTAAKKVYLPKMKGVGLGLHVNLTDGTSYNKVLAGNNGNYKRNFLGYLRDIYINKKLLQDVEIDLKTQFKLAIDRDKLKIDHVNGHDHVHMIPPIFEIVARLCKSYGIKHIRVVNEDYYSTNNLGKDLEPFLNTNIIKLIVLNAFAGENTKIANKYKLKTTDRFYGLIHTGNMDVNAFKGALLSALDKKYPVIEILSHPVYKSKKDIKFTSEFIKNYVNKEQRLIEGNALKNKNIKDLIKKSNIKLVNFLKI